jgi:hypothetical protein
MKQMNVHKNVNLAEKTFLFLPPAGPHCVGEHLQCKDGVLCFERYIASMDIFNALPSPRGLDPPQKLFIHGQPALQGPSLHATFSPINPLLRGVAAQQAGVCHLRVSSCSFAANNRNDAVPKNLFALNPIICYNQIMSDSNFKINNLDLEKRSLNAKAYREKISHAIL